MPPLPNRDESLALHLVSVPMHELAETETERECSICGVAYWSIPSIRGSTESPSHDGELWGGGGGGWDGWDGTDGDDGGVGGVGGVGEGAEAGDAGAIHAVTGEPPIATAIMELFDATDGAADVPLPTTEAPQAADAANPEHSEGPVRLPCGHVFGELCLRHWLVLRRRDTCPMCRCVLYYSYADTSSSSSEESSSDDDDDLSS